MDFFDAVANRHSYRGKYSAHPVPVEDLQKIVQAGIDAPSGCNMQTTEFVIVTDRKDFAERAWFNRYGMEIKHP
jgi:nitroreductase